MLDRKNQQALWVFGALERLQSLRILHGASYGLSPEGIDLFLEIDEHRDALFDNENNFDDLVCYICRERNPDQTKDDLAEVIQVVRDYRDRREDLVRFALTHLAKN